MKETLRKAIALLKRGKVIAFPTDTVFGIGALLSKPKAIKKIYKIKKRPGTKPLQILIASLQQAKELGVFNPTALNLAKRNWPGPLTLVVNKTEKVPKLVTGGSSKVGLRIPNHKTILQLIKKCGPIVASSANKSEEKPALTAKEVINKLPEIKFVLPGRVKTKRASKVIDASEKLKILRSP